ncbi:hypothetical protein Tco_0184749 [Tanacetum coccineum]
MAYGLLPRDQRHQYLRFEGLQYTDVDIVDFETRLAMGLHTSKEIESDGFGAYWAENARQIPDKGDMGAYWIGISSARDFLGTLTSYTLIRDLMLRLCHMLIACSIVRRSQAPEKVTMTDLFYMRVMDVGSVNVPYLLARYLRLFTLGRKQGAMISRGEFVARLAKHFRLFTEMRLQGLTVIVRELSVIDMAELVRLQICEEIDDTWAWVASGPERQQVAAAGTREVAEDAPIVDKGRLEEDVHGLRGALGEQREVLDSMACNFSRFTTWTVTGLSWMMDQAGVKYTSYADFQISYVRRTKHRTDDASTSTPQHPDP